MAGLWSWDLLERLLTAAPTPCVQVCPSLSKPVQARIYFTASIVHFLPLWRSVWVTSTRVQTGIQEEFSRLCGWPNPGQSLPRYVLLIRTSTAPLPKGAAVLGGYTMPIGCPKRRAGHKRAGSQMDIISAILVLKIAT